MKNGLFLKLPILFILFAVVPAFTINAYGQTKKEKKEAAQLVKDGDKAFAQKNYQMALDSYSKAIGFVPDDAYAHYRKGFTHYYLKQLDMAVPELDTALAKGYKPVEIYKVRWQLNLERKNYDAAADDVAKILKAEPNNSDYLLALAEINFDRGAYPDAVENYQKALVKNPGSGNIYYHLALSKSKTGDLDGQAAAAEEAIKRNTQYLAESYSLIADARMAQKKYPEAIDAYERSLKAKPEQVYSYRTLAELYRGENRIDDAIATAKAGLRKSPNDGHIYTDITWYYSLAGRTDDAIAAGVSATRLLPNEYLGYTNLCRAYNDANKPELSVGACNSALRLRPDDGETYFYLGRAYALMGKQSEADKYYKKALTSLIEYAKNNPDNSDGLYLLGNAYAEDGQGAKALESYKRCLELNPHFAKAQFNIGIIMIGQKDKPGALEQYNALMTTDKVLAGKLKAEIDKL